MMLWHVWSLINQVNLGILSCKLDILLTLKGKASLGIMWPVTCTQKKRGMENCAASFARYIQQKLWTTTYQKWKWIKNLRRLNSFHLFIIQPKNCSISFYESVIKMIIPSIEASSFCSLELKLLWCTKKWESDHAGSCTAICTKK